ncbi:MAG: hypothetical protein NVS3B20_06910 [Polyangiales bacterium]
MLFSGYPFTWEGSLRAKQPGGSNINSGEARDFLLSKCAMAMSCTTCHDPHDDNGRASMDALEGPRGNAICTTCHQQYRGVDAVRAHTHHEPAGAGSACLSCHMPRKNMSLDTRLTRYHRIGSPNDPAKVERDRPVECALCHTDKSVRSLVETMESWWGKSFDRAALKELYGGLDENAILATLNTGKAHEQATAIYIAGRSKMLPAVPFLTAQVTHPYPLIRYYVVQALESIFDEPAPIDLNQQNEAIAAATRAWASKKGFALP